MQRVDIFHQTPRENINILFNMIQKCRTDLSIMKYRHEYEQLLKADKELLKVAKALVKEIEEVK